MNKMERHRNYLLKTFRVYFLLATKNRSQDNHSGPCFCGFQAETCRKVVVSNEKTPENGSRNPVVGFLRLL
jgi:hypothetical protein